MKQEDNLMEDAQILYGSLEYSASSCTEILQLAAIVNRSATEAQVLALSPTLLQKGFVKGRGSCLAVVETGWNLFT